MTCAREANAQRRHKNHTVNEDDIIVVTVTVASTQPLYSVVKTFDLF
jgi:hypothetical protein